MKVALIQDCLTKSEDAEKTFSAYMDYKLIFIRLYINNTE